MRNLPDPENHDGATALGTFIAASIDHLTGTDSCCPRCCPQCNALYFYWNGPNSEVADTAVELALLGQTPDWIYDGGINWPYLIQFWPQGDDHLPSCQPL